VNRRRLAVGAATFTLLAASAGCAALRPIARSAMTPRGAWSDEAPPPPPDYADDGAWSALPGRDDAGDPVPTGTVAADQLAAPADVFYVHPTTYVGKRWNGPVDDPGSTPTPTGSPRRSRPPRSTAAAPCTPRATARPTAPRSSSRATTQAARSTWRWRTCAARSTRSSSGGAPTGRSCWLATARARSSPSGCCTTSSRRGPLRDHLVVAVLPGGGVTLDGLRAHDLAPCAAPDDVGCVVAWNARGPGFRPNPFDLQRPDGVDNSERLCTNPLSWRLDGVAVAAEHNRGAVFLEFDGAPRPGFADARCVAGTLVVSELQRPPRDLPSRILDHVLGPENYHPIEYQLYFLDLRVNVEARVAAFGR
jgi:hypothetical protein